MFLSEFLVCAELKTKCIEETDHNDDNLDILYNREC